MEAPSGLRYINHDDPPIRKQKIREGGLGITLAIARRLHGYALPFTDKFFFGRAAGARLTFIVLGVEAVMCVYQAIVALRLA